MGEITVSGLGKAYRQYPSQWSRLAEWVSFDLGPKQHVEHWVLRDVSFRVGAGEARIGAGLAEPGDVAGDETGILGAERRGSATVASALYEDLTPPEEPSAAGARPVVEAGEGRPTKRDRRRFDKLTEPD